MKRISLFIFIVILSGCGNATLTRVLGSQSPLFQDLNLEEKSKSIFFACDFEKVCFDRQTRGISREVCRSYEDYQMNSQRECESQLNELFLALYEDNKENVGAIY